MSLTGELDLATGPDLAEALESLPLLSGQVMIVDLSDLTFCDCAGIGAPSSINGIGYSKPGAH